LPETLDYFQLPWEWDERDTEYIIIKHWVNEDFQEELFEHTRQLREHRLLLAAPPHHHHGGGGGVVELKVNDKDRDKMFIVRKKSPRRSWFFT